MGLAALGAFDAANPGLGWLALSYAATAAMLGGWLLGATRRGWSAWLVLAPALGIAVATLIRVAVTSGIDADESEHLHLAFAIGRDLMPYRDLDQNHSPFVWMLSAPLLALLPESPYVLLVFRLLCLASFAGSITIACRLSRTLWRGGAYQTPFCVLLGLVYATQAEAYRFRPDAFMNTLALASLYLLVRPPEPGAKRSRTALLAGLLQGLAVAFSPKVAHLALAAPLLLWLREGGVQPASDRLRATLLAALLYGAGFALALAPVLLWLAWHGLMADAFRGIVTYNLGFATRRIAEGIPQQPAFYNSVLEIRRLVEMAPFFALALVGSAMVMVQRVGPAGVASRSLRQATVAAWLLWLSVWTFTPNAATYHVAGALVLAGALGAPALDAIAGRWQRAGGCFGMGLLIALCLGTAPLRTGWGGFVRGYSYPLSSVAWLHRAVRERGDSCLCIVPWHPIFTANVAPVYRSNEVRSGRWSEAVAWTLSNRPAAVMAPRFAGLVKRGALSEAERARMMQFLNAHYELVSRGTAGFWLLRDDR